MDGWEVSGLESVIAECNERISKLLCYIRRLEADRKSHGGFWTDDQEAEHFQEMREACDLTDEDMEMPEGAA